MIMRAFCLSWLSLALLFCLLYESCISLGDTEHASSPPRGWNSYDSFCWIISEDEFLRNAQLVAQHLKDHGYEYVVVDYLWYRRKVQGAHVDSLGFDVIDEWGRMVPDPGRWPSSKDGIGFAKVAEKVHGMGLKFGIHVMRGVSTQAYNANTPILDVTTGKAYEEDGRKWSAKDIGMKERACAWMKNGFMSVNTKLGAGRAFLRSLYQQYAEWGVDFVKHDCVFGEDLDLEEIRYVSRILTELNHSILYSLSPGTSVTPAMARDVSDLVNMYRITGDDWDTWGDVAAHFDISRDFAASNMVGAKGLRGKSWPDLDMLPLGSLTDPGSNEGPHRKCKLNLDEQRTQVTLWAMAKSPLMFGGDMRNLDQSTLSIITNPTLLEINSFSLDNKEFPYISIPKSRKRQKSNVKEPIEFRLTSCRDIKAKGWSDGAIDGDDQEQVCWKKESRKGYQQPFCLYKRTAPVLDDDLAYRRNCNHKIHLFNTKTTEICLGASANQRLTSQELKRGSFSYCSWHANQIWELKHSGTLLNSYSGLCASIRTGKANSDSARSRAWVATGRRGEIYAAIFNLDTQKAEISMRISDLRKALPGKDFERASCKCKEEWTAKDFGVVNDSISTQVETHGVALFILNCTFS
ncbi:Melibiase family protein [Striga hermonthica]|uniref:Alpha-galactosidase n=1 Tax=Striga hermonthica TaxID=68872 RepID=A0A9N7R672_STRHE|nr:Melibiase family protein [Striga hermonthica]